MTILSLKSKSSRSSSALSILSFTDTFQRLRDESWAVCSPGLLGPGISIFKTNWRGVTNIGQFVPCLMRTWNFDIQNKFARSYKSWTVYRPALLGPGISIFKTNSRGVTNLGRYIPLCFIKTWNFDIQNKLARSYFD